VCSSLVQPASRVNKLMIQPPVGLPSVVQYASKRPPPAGYDDVRSISSPMLSSIRRKAGIDLIGFRCVIFEILSIVTPGSSIELGQSCTILAPVELQRQFLALRRAGALPLQAWLERRGLGSCALPTHRELPFVYNWGVLRTPLFYQIKSLCNCTSAAPEPLVPQSKRSTAPETLLAQNAWSCKPSKRRDLERKSGTHVGQFGVAEDWRNGRRLMRVVFRV